MFSIGQRLREERERLGLSQDRLGEELGVDRKVIRNYEGNKTSPRADQLEKLMELGADVFFILTGSHAPAAAVDSSESDKPAERLAAAVRVLNLSEEDAQMVKVMAVRLAREK